MSTEELLNELHIRRNRQARPVHKILKSNQPVHGISVDKWGRLIPAIMLNNEEEEIIEATYPDSPRRRINGAINDVNSRPAKGMSPPAGTEKKSPNMKPVKPVNNLINSGDDEGEFYDILMERLNNSISLRRIEIASEFYKTISK